jgi:hypothetical protein
LVSRVLTLLMLKVAIFIWRGLIWRGLACFPAPAGRGMAFKSTFRLGKKRLDVTPRLGGCAVSLQRIGLRRANSLITGKIQGNIGENPRASL